MVDIQYATVEIKRGKKKNEEERHHRANMACPIRQGGHNKFFLKEFQTPTAAIESYE